MFDALLRLLTGSDDAPPADGNDPALALAVLLLETARSDDSVAESERRIIERALARRFDLQPFETARLVEAARQGVIRSTDLYNSTRIVVQHEQAGRVVDASSGAPLSSARVSVQVWGIAPPMGSGFCQHHPDGRQMGFGGGPASTVVSAGD